MNTEKIKNILNRIVGIYEKKNSKVYYINGIMQSIYIDLSHAMNGTNKNDFTFLSDIDLAYVYQERYIRVYKDNNSNTYINGKFTSEQILEIFSDLLPQLKTYNLDELLTLSVGDFIGEYIEGKLSEVLRVSKIRDKEIIAFELSYHSETQYTFPSAYSFTELIDKGYKILSKEEVLSLVVDIDYNTIVSELDNFYRTTTTPERSIGSLMHTYKCFNLKFNDFKLFRVHKDNKVYYNPFGNFVFWGHPKIILPKVE